MSTIVKKLNHAICREAPIDPGILKEAIAVINQYEQLAADYNLAMQAMRTGLMVKPTSQQVLTKQVVDLIKHSQLELHKIDYDINGPSNLPDTINEFLLYGREGEFASGPVLGKWDDAEHGWTDNQLHVIDWKPLYYAIVPGNPERSISNNQKAVNSAN